MIEQMIREQERNQLHADQDPGSVAAASAADTSQTRGENTVVSGNNTTSCGTSSQNAPQSGDSDLSKGSASQMIDIEKVRRAYQDFVEAEHMMDALMPTITAPLPVLTRRQVAKY